MPTSTESPRLLIPRPILAAMLAQAAAERPNECCGLLGGSPSPDGRSLYARSVHPLVNAAGSPTDYESEPRSMFDAMRELRRAALDVVAVYHSHPSSPPFPSRKDLALSWGDRVVNLIISLQSAQPEVRAWRLTATDYREADWECVEDR
ncbi:MAG TPA: Mov34/MPN/PAD-1 family protein [Gemmataceae bacterium]|jgi:proteasome lid subunit RPN8/RPN11|nr:Mov34/MPN/PAD-1 family protein [Gemmataceae bacterium]